MSIDTPDELEHLRATGRVVADAIRAMRAAVAPGVTTGELDRIGARVFRAAGARSGPQLDYGFPGATCISVNDEAVHGIPGPRRLRAGDLVKLDVTAELDGFYADACVSVAVAKCKPSLLGLAAAARRGLDDGLRAASAGAPLQRVGAAVEAAVTKRGHRVCRELAGHGIGRRIHEPPTVPSYADADATERLTEGLVMTIEPIVSAGSGEVRIADDGWTMLTVDGAPSAHVEHTVVITSGAPLILTH
jgi:methionyl aminopeptidase